MFYNPLHMYNEIGPKTVWTERKTRVGQYRYSLMYRMHVCQFATPSARQEGAHRAAV